MKKYEVLEHKADLKIRIFGKTKEELFQNALVGMQDCLRAEIRSTKSLPGRQAGETRNIKIESPDLPALLVDFLSEVLYLIQTNKETYQDIKFKKFSDTELEAELDGQKAASFGEDIKAVTYHGLEVEQENNVWQAVILFDI